MSNGRRIRRSTQLGWDLERVRMAGLGKNGLRRVRAEREAKRRLAAEDPTKVVALVSRDVAARFEHPSVA